MPIYFFISPFQIFSSGTIFIVWLGDHIWVCSEATSSFVLGGQSEQFSGVPIVPRIEDRPLTGTQSFELSVPLPPSA